MAAASARYSAADAGSPGPRQGQAQPEVRVVVGGAGLDDQPEVAGRLGVPARVELGAGQRLPDAAGAGLGGRGPLQDLGRCRRAAPAEQFQPTLVPGVRVTLRGIRVGQAICARPAFGPAALPGPLSQNDQALRRPAGNPEYRLVLLTCVQTLPSDPQPAPGARGLTLAPFRGVRYASDRVSGIANVTSPPYDVIGPGTVRAPPGSGTAQCRPADFARRRIPAIAARPRGRPAGRARPARLARLGRAGAGSAARAVRLRAEPARRRRMGPGPERGRSSSAGWSVPCGSSRLARPACCRTRTSCPGRCRAGAS